MSKKFKNLKVGDKIKHKNHNQHLTVLTLINCRNGYTIETEFGLDRLINFEPIVQ